MPMFLNPPKSRIILALDTPDRSKSIEIMDQCHDVVDAIKVNYPLVLQEGLFFIKELKEAYGLPIIADFKIADAPVTNNRIVRMAKSCGVSAVMVHGFIGADAVMEIMEVAGDDLGVFIVTELTHPGGLEYTRPHSMQFAEMAAYLGCYGIQAPGTRPDQIRVLRESIGPDMKIIACGIGAQGGVLQEAIEAGADFGIVGRAIYEAHDPKQAAIRIARGRHEDKPVIQGVHVVRYCAETVSYTLRLEPVDEMRELLKQFIAYCKIHRIGLRLNTDDGILLRKDRSIMHLYSNGSCLLSNMPSVEKGEAFGRNWLEEIRSDMQTNL